MFRSVWIRILSKRKLAALCSLLAFPVLLVSSCAAIKYRNETTDPWSVVKGYSLSSVAWSPKGDHIAFVATIGEDYGDDFGSIWMISVQKPGQAPKLRQLTRLSGEQGIPVALFWLDNNRIGWAASLYPKKSEQDYTFLKMGLYDSKPQPLVNQSFSGIQSRSAAGGYGGPEDVYYDAVSRTLLFSGVETGGAYIRILPLSTKKVRTLSLPNEVDEACPITLSGSLKNPKRPELYIAAAVNKADENGQPSRRSQIWLSYSFSLRQDRILATSSNEWLFFPRVSPDGKTLACLAYQTDLLLFDLKSDQRRRIGVIQPLWDGIQPAHGCPFAWSPDGKMIAYADGSKIKMAKVATEAAPIVQTKIQGVESKGMLLAADVDGRAVILTPDQDVPPGSPVR